LRLLQEINRMMRRLTALLGLVILVAGCEQGTMQQLGDRMQFQLAPQLANGQAGLQRLQDGAQVTLADATLFPSGSAELSDQGRYVLASVVEGLMAPNLLQIDVSESPATPAGLQQARVQAVTQFLNSWQLAPELVAPISQQTVATTAPQTMAITVRRAPDNN
jgi:hypothetical protein